MPLTTKCYTSVFTTYRQCCVNTKPPFRHYSSRCCPKPWCLTWNNYAEDDVEFMKKAMDYKYLVTRREKAKKEPHIYKTIFSCQRDKRCARWVPHQLTEEQKVGREQWCLTMLEIIRQWTRKLTRYIVSGDET